MVRSIFENCCQVWSSQYATHIEKCEALQKSAVKWILMAKVLQVIVVKNKIMN